MSITELKGKKEVGYKEESIYGTNGDKLSLVAYNADNIRIEYTLTVSSENIQAVTIEDKTISVSLYNHRTIHLANRRNNFFLSAFREIIPPFHFAETPVLFPVLVF